MNLEIYVRGKSIGFIDREATRKHRLRTLGLEDEFEEMSRRLELDRQDRQSGKSQKPDFEKQEESEAGESADMPASKLDNFAEAVEKKLSQTQKLAFDLNPFTDRASSEEAGEAGNQTRAEKKDSERGLPDAQAEEGEKGAEEEFEKRRAEIERMRQARADKRGHTRQRD